VTPYEVALEQLPSTYAQLLRLADAGTSEAEICRQLDVEPEGLEALLDIAARKLQNRLTDS
jgi:DNA-directed RNA polymerase specialized sigma24 family protein